MTERIALVLGGTGMLAGCAAALLADGWKVVLPSRRPRFGLAARAALVPRGHRLTGVAEDHRPTGVAQAAHPREIAADWARPEELADRVRAALDGPVDLLVAWVHSTYRESVLRAVAPLLAPHAPVVEVHDSGAVHRVHGLPEPVIEGHPTQQVVLGHVKHGAGTRWLSHQETSDGVLAAVHRALEGRPPSTHQVGEVGVW
jgi:NAD(P)-dependent dehydrogenase (short-subunit alcohol dehydrogenase family)